MCSWSLVPQLWNRRVLDIYSILCRQWICSPLLKPSLPKYSAKRMWHEAMRYFQVYCKALVCLIYLTENQECDSQIFIAMVYIMKKYVGCLCYRTARQWPQYRKGHGTEQHLAIFGLALVTSSGVVVCYPLATLVEVFSLLKSTTCISVRNLVRDYTQRWREGWRAG